MEEIEHMMTIQEVARISALTARTLRWYDRIGLVVPDRDPFTRYRRYGREDLKNLQQVVYFRELGFSLDKIKRIMDDPKFDRASALKDQLSMLKEKRKAVEQMIKTLESAIAEEKGVHVMHDKERFEGFDFSHNPYEQEARKRWGEDTVDKANATLSSLGGDGQEELSNRMENLFRALAKIREIDPASQEAQEAIGRWYDLLNTMGHYSPDMFGNLGRMYVDDPRFTKNIDKYGEGLALFMRDAMIVYSGRKK